MTEKYFTLFHYSMSPLTQLDIETRHELGREQWIRYALSERFSFAYRGGVELHWVPKGELEESLYGVIQREVPHAQHMPPDEGGDEIVRPEWQGAYVLIDPTSHETGQRVAVENDEVGKPETLMQYLFKAINHGLSPKFLPATSRALGRFDAHCWA